MTSQNNKKKKMKPANYFAKYSKFIPFSKAIV